MERVSGIGGVFFKSKDPERLRAWYQDNLGLEIDPSFGGASFTGTGTTVWSPFESASAHFAGPIMINYRVANLDAMLAQLKANGVPVEDKIDDSGFGHFGWATDCDGNRFELWQPKSG